MTMFGLEVSLPWALRFILHARLAAKTARMIASEEPMVDTPSASACGLSRGALNSRAMLNGLEYR